MYRIIFATLLAMSWVVGFSQSKKSPKPVTLFTVGKQAITTEEFIYLYKKNHQNKEDLTQPKIEEYLQLFINFKLKVAEARNRGIDTTAAFLKEYNSYKDELRKPYLPEGKIIDSLVKVTYTRLQEEVRVSHILISLKSDAASADTLLLYNKIVDIKNKALAGEDFGSLAALYSEEPNARTTKGDLGYFTAMQMVYPFENAAYSGKPGDIVGPIRTRFGYHILKIEDRKPARGEVEVSHIMIRTGTERDAAKSKNLIFEIHDQLRGGVSWEDLCKQYSEDPGSKNSGGKLRPFGVGAMATVPEFDRAAFSLQNTGDISDPFQTQYGWHIVRLERKIPLPPLSELSTTLRGRVARDERTQISRQALIKKLKNDFSFQENLETKTKVFALADTSLTKGKWGLPIGFSGSKEILFSMESKSVMAQDFLNYVKQNQKVTSLSPGQYIEQLYAAYVETTINEVLEDQIITSHPEFVLLLKEYYEGILLFDIMEKEVWKKASEDSLGQRKYFELNEKKYLADERAHTVLYSSGTPEMINTLKQYVEKNDSISIQKLIKAKSVRQEVGTFQKTDRPVLSKIEWRPGLYSVENSGISYLVQVKEMKPPGPLTFEEARASIISDYQDYIEQTWLEQLKLKYPVKVNEKAKKYVVQELKP
jgi:peptidyl-prolyl cis-trans isomerase SurA